MLAGSQVSDRGLREEETAPALLQPQAQRRGGVPRRAAGRPPLLPHGGRIERIAQECMLKSRTRAGVASSLVP